jgi:hypothetical protein
LPAPAASTAEATDNLSDNLLTSITGNNQDKLENELPETGTDTDPGTTDPGTTDPGTTDPTPVSTALTGLHQAALVSDDSGDSPDQRSLSGTVTGDNEADQASLTIASSSNLGTTESLKLDYSMTPVDPTATYTPLDITSSDNAGLWTTESRSLTLSDGNGTVSYSSIDDDGPGQFTIFRANTDLALAQLDDTDHYTYHELGFAGQTPSAAADPGDQVLYYSGYVSAVTKSSSDAILGAAEMRMDTLVNPNNRKVVCFLDKLESVDKSIDTKISIVPDSQFLIGTIADDGSLVNIRVFGSGNAPDGSGISAVKEETGGTGQVYGEYWQGLGLDYQVNSFNLSSTTTDGNGQYELIAGSMLADKVGAAGTGTITLKGFASGVSDNMTDPFSASSRIMLTETAGDFTITADYDDGTLDGTMRLQDLAAFGDFSGTTTTSAALGDFSTTTETARDYENGSDTRLTLRIGEAGGDNSAFILDDIFVAELTGDETATGEPAVQISGTGGTLTASGPLQSVGNYLETAGPGDWNDDTDTTEAPAPSDWMKWGYWEAAYVNPETNVAHHVHSPSTLWVATELPMVNVNDVTGFTAEYTGAAQCIVTQSSNTGQDQTTWFGKAVLDFDFTTKVFDGTLSFTNSDSASSLSMATDGTIDAASGFQGSITSITENSIATTPAGSALTGGFFGGLNDQGVPKNILGNFGAIGNDNTRYNGIFGGDVTNSTRP